MTTIRNFPANLENSSPRKPTLSTISDFGSKYGIQSENSENLDLNSSPPIEKKSFFSYDFEAPMSQKADKCLVNKTKTMKVGEFWDELTRNSQRKLVSSFRLAKLSFDKFLEHSKKLRVMFKRPDVCCDNGRGENSMHSLGLFQSIAFKGKSAIFYMNMNEVNSFNYNIVGNYGNFNKLYLNDRSKNDFFSCVSNIAEMDNLLSFGCFKQGMISLYDLNTCSKVLDLKNKGSKSTFMQIASKGNLVVSGDDRCVVSLFDIRMNSMIGQISDFQGSETLPISLDLEGRNILLGTSDGPISYNISQMSTGENRQHIFRDSGVYNKSLFLTNSSNFIINGEINSNNISVITDFKDQSKEPEMNHIEFAKNANLIDFDVSKDTGEVAILYKDKQPGLTGDKRRCSLIILEPLKSNGTPNFKIRDQVELEGKGLRVAFTRDMDLFALTDQDWNLFNCKNTHFVKSLVEKVKRTHGRRTY